MNLSEYETTLVVRPDVGGDVVEATLDRVRDAVKTRGGKLLAINHWGRKKLAYAIEKHTRGVYVHTHYLGGGDLVSEIERNLRISDNVLRFLTVRLANDIDPTSREEKAYVAPQYDAEEALDEADDHAGSADAVEAAGDDHGGEAARAPDGGDAEPAVRADDRDEPSEKEKED